MPVTRIADLRRQQLIQAAYRVIQREGLRFSTIAKIETEAQVTKGTVHHYFQNRQELLQLAMRQVHALRRKDLIQKLTQARTGSERVWAIISVSLEPKYLQQGFCKAWLSLSAEAAGSKDLSRLIRIIHAREKSNLVDALRRLGEAGDIAPTALSIKALLEGIRRRVHFLTPPYRAETARAEVLAFLKRSVPNFDQSAAGRRR